MRTVYSWLLATSGALILTALTMTAAAAHAGESHAEDGTSFGWLGVVGVVAVAGLGAWVMNRGDGQTPSDADQKPEH